ncbi:hypothetical protein QE152_g30130 [Popillia japonica]|uniref:Aquaporin n=1 Tax=Popillia japonica TaxID=7064 RepID=A0AAW1JER3_POPJA
MTRWKEYFEELLHTTDRKPEEHEEHEYEKKFICGFVRGVIKRNVNDGLLRQLVLEFIATAELCATCFELIIVADNYGVWVYGGFLFVLTVWWSFHWETALVADNYGVWVYGGFLFVLTVWWSFHWETATACPYCPIEEIFERKRNVFVGLLLVGAQVLGGLAIFRYIQVLWSFELVETHKGRAFEDCSTDLQVPVLVGAFIEGVATCACRVISKILGETNTRVSNILDAFFGTSLVVAAFNYSGGYFNPALATALKYGCQGSTIPEHMLVYWLGPMIGAIFSVFLFNSKAAQNVVKTLTGKRD